MQTEQLRWTADAGWSGAARLTEADLVLAFAPTRILEQKPLLEELQGHYPRALVSGCSSAGVVEGSRILDRSLTCTAVRFRETRIESAVVEVTDPGLSREAGVELARRLPVDSLIHVLVFSCGLGVNGSQLVAGLREALPHGVQASGGMAGDGHEVGRTAVLLGTCAAPERVVALGLYSGNLQVTCASMGGWDAFGPERRITRSRANVVYELDGRPALELYSRYLGELAAQLPGSALLFPLHVLPPGEDREVVRTILSVDPDEGSMTFAGDMPEGSIARLMKTNNDRLIDGACLAAKACRDVLGLEQAQFALLVSCEGRRMVLKQRTEEELEEVEEMLGTQARLSGFYSSGEICPAADWVECQLHNQSMTVTAFVES